MTIRRSRIRHRKHRRGPARTVMILFGLLMTMLIIGIGSVVGWVVAVADTGPNIQSLTPRDPGRSSEIFARDGTSLGFIQSDVVRLPVAEAVIPNILREATVSVEDRRFYEHQGVDFEGVIRAAVANLGSGKTVQGGSTLTMQLVKNLYSNNERTITRKIREAKLAQELEDIHPGRAGKTWILDKYLNSVPYGTAGGQQVIGVGAAARAYFNKSVKDLTLGEAAMIAGLPQAPTEYNPIYHPQAATQRRNDVLDKMEQQGYITYNQAAGAKRETVGLGANNYFSKKRESLVVNYVKQQLIKKYGKTRVEEGGLKVYTTISLKMQQQARKAISDQLAFGDPPSSAVVTIDPSSGQILAMASSASYSDLQFNLPAQIKRQPGSSFKIMALMAAVRKGVRPESTYYVSRPLKFTDPKYGPIDVSTFEGTYDGSENLVTATLKSDNTVYTQLALDIGPDQVKKAAVDMGIVSPLFGYPSETLGGLKYGVTPLEMSNAYATIADGGYRNKPTAIQKVIFPATKGHPAHTDNLGHPKRAKTFINGVTGEVTKILQDNVKSGTGTNAATTCPTGGKTGTTDDFRNAWFVGITPKYSTSVWVGYMDSREMLTQNDGGPVQGASLPAKIWGEYMNSVVKGQPCGSFPKITQPVTASPFKGKYASGGGSGSYGPDGAYSTTPDSGTGTTGTGTGNGTGGGTGNGTGTGGTNKSNTVGGNIAAPPAAHPRDPGALNPTGGITQ